MEKISFRDGRYVNAWPTHNWFYPDLHGGGKTVTSLRLLHVRDGHDDHDYLTIYKAALKGREMHRDIASAFPSINIEKDTVEFTVPSNRRLGEIRDFMAREIVRLRRE